MKSLVIHHSGDPSPSPQFEKINAYHKSKNFPRSSLGFYVGYNWVLEQDGSLRQSRSLEDYGAHTDALCGEGHCNIVAVAVCLAGDFTKEDPTQEQLAKLYLLWKQLDYPKIWLHKDVKDTTCPGNFPYRSELRMRWLLDLRNRLANATKALPRFAGTNRGNMIQRLIERLRKTILQEESGE